MKIPVQLLEYATRETVDAELFDDVTVEHFLEAQDDWRPLVRQAVKKMLESGAPREILPRHYHWDWSSKESDLRVLAFTFYGITCSGKLQGLMKLETAGHNSRLATQKRLPLVYVDYIETAPWNVKVLAQALGDKPKFGAVGTRLIEAAVRKSLEEGFRGRLGLHSLSTSERFYLDICGMTAVGRDPAKQDLLWYEFTPEQAERFLAGGAA